MTLLIIRDGPRQLLAVCQRGECELLDFVKGLEGSDPREHSRFLRALERLASGEQMLNTQLFRKLRNGIWELKSKGGLARAPCFFDEDHRVVFTHAMSKPKPSVLREEIKRACRLRQQYFTDKSHGNITILEELP